MMGSERQTRYFVAKCDNITTLKRCVESGIWACRDRQTPPHPRKTLTEAFQHGPVILIFSVVNCHGWHGYCEMTSLPGVSEEQVQNSKNPQGMTCTESVQACEPLHQDLSSTPGIDCDQSHPWHRFHVQWKVVYVEDFGQKCLSSEVTSAFQTLDDQAVNKARNLQELPAAVGGQMCTLMNEYYQELCDIRTSAKQAQLAKQPSPFFNQISEQSDVWDIWKKMVEKVEIDLGKVLLACPFGSQRYNLDTAESDMDMFIVYQADTRALLGLNPPKHTIKNRESETCDYTVHEVHRYCELLISGDPRCVETLFLHPSSMVHCSEDWKMLQANQHIYLNSECLEKYLRDGLGSNGLKQFQKWLKGKNLSDPLPSKISKLIYIIVRLLQNACDLSTGTLNVYRPDESTERQQLMDIRSGDITGERAQEIIDQLIEQIEANKFKVPGPTIETREVTEKWLLQLRYKHFMSHPPD